MPKVIDSFDGQFSFLSNFYPCPVLFEGEFYPTLEHAFQAAKTLSPNWRATIKDALTPGQAKRMGRKLTLRSDWEQIKLQVMESLVRVKFRNPMNLHLRQQLINTYPATLIEGNTWGDQFWGVCQGKGENHLGKILMKVREELKGE